MYDTCHACGVASIRDDLDTILPRSISALFPRFEENSHELCQSRAELIIHVETTEVGLG